MSNLGIWWEGVAGRQTQACIMSGITGWELALYRMYASCIYTHCQFITLFSWEHVEYI